MSSLKFFANSPENLVKYSSTCESLDSRNPVIGFLPALLPRWHYFILQNPFVFNCQTAGVTESSLAHLSPTFANFHFQLFTIIRRFHTSVMTNYWWKPGSIFVSIPTYIYICTIWVPTVLGGWTSLFFNKFIDCIALHFLMDAELQIRQKYLGITLNLKLVKINILVESH